MSQLYLVPDIRDIGHSIQLAGEYDCAFEYNDFYDPAVLDDPEKQEEIIACYKKYRRDFSMDTMHGAFLDVTIHSSDPRIREVSMLRIHQSMEIAKKLGLKAVIFHTGRLAGFRVDFYLEQWKKQNASFFRKLAEEYPDQQIYMENMFDEAPDILAGLAENMKDVKNFGVCLDYAHAALTGCPGSEWVETLADYICHIHINDNDLHNDLHQPLGTGQIDWKDFDCLLRKHQVDASVLIEVNGFDAQKKSLAYMKQHGIYPENYCK